MKFTPKGTIAITAVFENSGMKIQVNHTGQGMPEKYLNPVLEPFGQARQKFDITHGGIGLGLYPAIRYTELHGGTLELQSSITKRNYSQTAFFSIHFLYENYRQHIYYLMLAVIYYPNYYKFFNQY